jgi:hypothetical protein
MTPAPTRRSALLSTSLVLLVSPAVLGLTLVALLFAGWVALAIPLVAAAIVYLYRLVVQSAESYEGKVVAREVGAAVLAIAVGFGAWVAAIVVGVLTEVLPFIAEVKAYPYADAWNVGSAVVGILVVPATWGVLRRLADPSLRTSGKASN